MLYSENLFSRLGSQARWVRRLVNGITVVPLRPETKIFIGFF